MNSRLFLGWFEYAINRVGNGYFGFAERVYCYELYHYIRVAMHGFEREHGAIEGVFLHSELVKSILPDDAAQIMEVIPLKTRRMPDFLFHSPGNFDNQIAAIEVKTTPRLSYCQLIRDLEKLSELRVNYQYQLVIFHCVNSSMEIVCDHVNRAVNEGLDVDGNILVVTKPAFGEPIQKVTIGEIIARIT